MMRLFLAAAALTVACSAAAAPAGQALIIRQTVADYAKWRPIYDAHQPIRSRAGLTNCRAQSAEGNVNDVVVVCDMADVAKAKAFAASKDLAAAMARGGVVGKASFYVMEPGH